MLLAFPKPSPTSIPSKSGHLALPYHPLEGCPVLSHHAQTAGSAPGDWLSPDVFSGCLAMLLDGGALIFVVQPSRSLAGPVAVVGKLALATAVEPLLSFEAGMTDDVCQAGRTEGPVGSYLSEGPAPPSEGPASFASLCSPHPLRTDPLTFFGRMEKPPTQHNVRALAQCCCFGYAKETNILFKGGQQ